MSITLTGCKLNSNKSACTSSAGTGTILISSLAGTLRYTDAEAHEVGIDLAPESPGRTAQFSCGGVSIEFGGSLLVGISGDINTITTKTESTFTGGTGDALESYLTGSGPFESPFKDSLSGNGEKLEIKA